MCLTEPTLQEGLDMGEPRRCLWDGDRHHHGDMAAELLEQYAEALAFIKRHLRRGQGKQGFHSSGILEVPQASLQELRVNALVHRDDITGASIAALTPVVQQLVRSGSNEGAP